VLICAHFCVGDGRSHRFGNILLGRKPGDGVGESFAGARILEPVEKHRSSKERREIERREGQGLLDRVKRAFDVARRAPHRAKLGPQSEARLRGRA